MSPLVPSQSGLSTSWTDNTVCGWGHSGGIAWLALQQYAREGCLKCRILVEGILKYEFLPYTGDSPRQKSPSTTALHEFTEQLRVYVRSWEPDPLSVVVDFTAMTKKIGCLPMELLFYSVPGLLPPYTELGSGGHVIADPSSNECFETIKSWIRRCDLEHPSCAITAGSQFLPTRILCVNSFDKDIKLCLSSSISAGARYLAVSHTWGENTGRLKPMPLLLTRNIDSRKERIEWDELTTTFQDSVVITRKLGLQYLWIDSLCILQDSVADWAFEASQMASVYKSAYIVAAATASRSGDDGFFNLRSPSYDIAACIGNDKLNNVYVQRQICHRTIVEEQVTTGTMPLLDRAWCFQERLLARRIVHFTEDEIMWECQEQLWCECKIIQNPSLHGKSPTTGNFKLSYASAMSTSDVNRRLEAWAKVVNEYSRRALTVATDRLPAISGIAKDIALPEMGRYLAGIWECQLPQALLWEEQFGLWERVSLQGARPTRFQAPTWSWASISSSALIWNSSGEESMCKVVEADCKLASQDPYGQVSHGHVRLVGPAATVYLHRTDRTLEGVRSSQSTVYETRVGSDVGSEDLGLLVHRDFDWTAHLMISKMLVVAREEESGQRKRRRWFGLILVPSVIHKGCWERIGTASGRGMNVPKCSEEEITIV